MMILLEIELNGVKGSIQPTPPSGIRLGCCCCCCMTSQMLNRTGLESKESRDEAKERDSTEPVKLDAPAIAHIEKHRKLQEDLTDEMVGLARQLKESSLLMNKSLQDTEKILDSTENAVEHSLASTGRANKRAMEVYSESFKTSCFTWIVIFMMTCVFFMVLLLIRVT